jgi:hypothetical protein
MLISWLLMEVKKDVVPADEVHTELLSKLKLITSLAAPAPRCGTARRSASGRTGSSSAPSPAAAVAGIGCEWWRCKDLPLELRQLWSCYYSLAVLLLFFGTAIIALREGTLREFKSSSGVSGNVFLSNLADVSVTLAQGAAVAGSVSRLLISGTLRIVGCSAGVLTRRQLLGVWIDG